jgi:hypothetical protein
LLELKLDPLTACHGHMLLLESIDTAEPPNRPAIFRTPDGFMG